MGQVAGGAGEPQRLRGIYRLDPEGALGIAREAVLGAQAPAHLGEQGVLFGTRKVVHPDAPRVRLASRTAGHHKTDAAFAAGEHDRHLGANVIDRIDHHVEIAQELNGIFGRDELLHRIDPGKRVDGADALGHGEHLGLSEGRLDRVDLAVEVGLGHVIEIDQGDVPHSAARERFGCPRPDAAYADDASAGGRQPRERLLPVEACDPAEAAFWIDFRDGEECGVGHDESGNDESAMLPQRTPAELPGRDPLQSAKGGDIMQRSFRRVLLLCALAAGLSPISAAPTAPTLMTETAVAAYEAGRREEAASLFAMAARAGNRLAQFNYAMMLYRDEAESTDPNAAWRWLRRAAGAGLPQAQFNLALLYDHGDGVRKSLTTAAEWYRRAAEQGHVDAQVNLASMYFVGHGVPRDYEAAARWFLSAARGGDAGAQYIVASMYEAGDGVTADLRQAAHWYLQAALQGDVVAREKYEVVRARLGETGP